MTRFDWKWKIAEATDRLRSRYGFIGRSTGAPFLALVYPPEAEAAFLHEWHAVARSLSPEFVVNGVDVLLLTQQTITQIGADNIVSAIGDPIGSDPVTDLGSEWISRIADLFALPVEAGYPSRPIVVLERLDYFVPGSRTTRCDAVAFGQTRCYRIPL